jgi:hypothetical protein
MIAGQWYAREIFRLEYETFKLNWSGDFHLSASLDEQYRLSCMFDVYLPTQVTLGSTVRPVGDESLIFRTEPNADAPHVGSLTVGANASILSGPACYDEMRWWQVRLEDGQEGWLPEANTNQFFSEPIR